MHVGMYMYMFMYMYFCIYHYNIGFGIICRKARGRFFFILSLNLIGEKITEIRMIVQPLIIESIHHTEKTRRMDENNALDVMRNEQTHREYRVNCKPLVSHTKASLFNEHCRFPNGYYKNRQLFLERKQNIIMFKTKMALHLGLGRKCIIFLVNMSRQTLRRTT